MSVTASVDGRVTLGRDRLLLDEENAQVWHSLQSASAGSARAELIEHLHSPTAILEGSGTFVTDSTGPLDLAQVPADDELFEDYLPPEVVDHPDHKKWFTVVDSRGRVRWTMKGGDGTDLLLVVARATPPAYLAYLRQETIPYLVAGEDRVDLPAALSKLQDRLGVSCVVSEAGGTLNAALLRADLIDELHLSLLPAAIAGKSVPTIFDGPELLPDESPTQLRLISATPTPGGTVNLRYKVIR
ncbi:RibD family protein [Kribbella steppae]|uniref:RibD family protein n=1 Tax=Kribbella steppae TaxID=2512223 RepID=UPI001F547918|nr:RibD family protein [Kribbella steppae]